MKLIAVVLLVLTSSSVSAGTLHKCVDAQGVASYQQTDCPAKSKEAGVRTYQPVTGGPNTSWTAQASTFRAIERQYDPPTQSVDQGNTTDPAAQRARQSQVAEIDRQISNIGTVNTRSERELLANLEAQLAQVSTNQPVTSPTYSAQDPAPPQTTIQHDQNGRNYIHPPGSSFVTDTVTGKQCLVNGTTIVECH